jgi:type VI secretion system protein ImpK
MPERSQNSYPLLREFREFYTEIARLRQIAGGSRASGQPASGQRQTAVAAAAPEADGAGGVSLAIETDDAVASRVWYEMTRYLDHKMYEVKAAASSFSHEILDQMLYIMAAYADETFLCLIEWSGKDYWSDRLMELRLFRSQVAGQEIFRRIDRLLARQDYGTEELAAVYLMMLALGFKGQYLREPGSIEIYRRKLFDRLLLTNPDLRWDGRRIFPEAYRHTVTEGAPVKMPEPKKWWGVIAAIIGAWLVVSTIAWLMVVGPTRKNLAVTRHALALVTSQHSTVETAAKWSSLVFEQQGDTFQLQLPATLPMKRTATGSAVAPLLIAVEASDGNSTASRIKEWLSSGLSRFPTNPYSAAAQTRAVAAVQQVSAPDGITAGETTSFFLVDPGLSTQDLALHPTLTFPSRESAGAAAVTLSIPDRTLVTTP